MTCSQKCLEKGQGILIVGRTTDGKTFRPSNWACRLADHIAQHDLGKQVATRYRPCLIPTLYEGQTALRVAKSLSECEKHSYIYPIVMQFAESNGLQIVK